MSRERGNFAMIIHYDFAGAETENLKTIRDSLELEETVDTLKSTTHQGTDTYRGTKQLDHAPAENYVIGHGIAGMAFDWFVPDDFAKQLIEVRGLAAGDKLTIITCEAGEAGGSAEQLAKAIGARGVVGVTVRAPEGYINWNSGGELLITSYAFADTDLTKASKAWTKAEDKAWKAHIGRLKVLSTRAFEAAYQVEGKAAEAIKILQAFADRRPDEKAASKLMTDVAKAEAVKRLPVYRRVIAESQPVPVKDEEEFDRAGTQNAWSTELRTLLAALHVLLVPGTGAATAKDLVTGCRAKLRSDLTAAWPAYSRGYFDRIRELAKGTSKQSKWMTYTSAAPAPVLPIDEERPLVETTFTTEELQTQFTQDIAEIVATTNST